MRGDTQNRASGTGNLSVLFQGLLFLFVGAFVSYLGYGSTAEFLVQEIIGPVLFWYAALLLLAAFPFRGAVKTFYVGIRQRLNTAIFAVYLVIHLVVYGFLLELLFTAVYGMAFALPPNLTVATEIFTPLTTTNLFFDLTFNPSISFSLPPVLSGALSAYAIAVAILVDILIVANVVKVRDLANLTTRGTRARSYFLVPLVGLVLGASCCISVPALVSFAIPSVTTSQSFDWIYNTTYFLFPPFAVLVLYLNFHAVSKLSNGTKSSEDNSSEKLVPERFVRNPFAIPERRMKQQINPEC